MEPWKPDGTGFGTEEPPDTQTYNAANGSNYAPLYAKTPPVTPMSVDTGVNGGARRAFRKARKMGRRARKERE